MQKRCLIHDSSRSGHIPQRLRRGSFIFSEFDQANIPHILDVVAADWSPPQADMAFKRFYAEYTVRHNIWDAKYSLQATDDEGHFLVACFSAERGAKEGLEKADKWILDQTDGGKLLTEEKKNSFAVSRSYLSMMDKKTAALMNDDDIKLVLFVSCQKGAGFPLLEKFKAELKAHGYKNMYLWTDSDCNYDWYFRRGYELVEKGIYEPFSGENEPYCTFVFRQKLL